MGTVVSETVDALLAEGTPVYVDFTAKWCATCQANKLRAYTPKVLALMKEKHVVALRRETKPNPIPRLGQPSRKYGRSAIPVNVLLTPGKDPVILPELLSPDHVLDALKKL